MEGVSLQPAEFWGRFLEIGFLNLLLSGDNAVAIALAVRGLDRRQRLLGQIWGSAGAIILRLLMVGAVSALFRVPLLRLGGGALLIWIAVKLALPEQQVGGRPRHGSSLREAVWIIIVADITMSVDNVLAIAAAARGDMLLVGVGIVTSLPLIVWGSGVLATLMNRHVWIVWLGGGLLGYVAVDMMLEDPVMIRWLGSVAGALAPALPLGFGGIVAALGWWRARTMGARESVSAEGRRRP
jgi:YjbE family integral membrane protein